MDEIVTKVINDLRDILKTNNLQVLVEMLDGLREHPKLNWHIHDSTLNKILTTNEDIYVCSH